VPKIAMSSCAMEESPCVEALMVAAENGFDAFEINICFPTVDLDNWNWNEIEALKEISRDAGINICIQSAYYKLNQPIQCQVIAAVRGI
jgi:sugar phosphate isomerase/epimerase